MVMVNRPLPSIVTGVRMTKPPAYVPGFTLIVSPVVATASASAMVVYVQPLAQTVTLVAACEAGERTRNADARSTAAPRNSNTGRLIRIWYPHLRVWQCYLDWGDGPPVRSFSWPPVPCLGASPRPYSAVHSNHSPKSIVNRVMVQTWPATVHAGCGRTVTISGGGDRRAPSKAGGATTCVPVMAIVAVTAIVLDRMERPGQPGESDATTDERRSTSRDISPRAPPLAGADGSSGRIDVVNPEDQMPGTPAIAVRAAVRPRPGRWRPPGGDLRRR